MSVNLSTGEVFVLYPTSTDLEGLETYLTAVDTRSAVSLFCYLLVTHVVICWAMLASATGMVVTGIVVVGHATVVSGD